MTAVGASVHPTPVGLAEFAEPPTVSGVRGPIDAVTPRGGGRHDGGDNLQVGVGAGGASGEVPNGLVAAAVGGDARARDELLVLIHPLVLRYCRGRLGRQESVLGSADDVAQDVCMAVVAALGTYQLKGRSFRAFVYGIAAHKVTDAFRTIVRNRTAPVAELPDVAGAAAGPEHDALAAERGAAVRALLARLTPHQREVLVLRVAAGMSAEETAQAVQSTAGAVRVTQHRALLRLRRIIQQGESAVCVVADRALDDAVSDEEPAGLAGDGTEEAARQRRG
jgi:RNA polymerase sigma-70 factor (ECF subfamily)